MKVLLLEDPRRPLSGLSRGLTEAGAITTADVVDLSSRKIVRFAVERAKPVAVVVTGGLEDPAECEEDPNRAFALNTEGAIHVAMAALEFDAVPVLISTARVFDEGVFAEDDEPRPSTVHGRTKLQGEQFLLRASPRALVVRVGHVFEDGLASERQQLKAGATASAGELLSPIGAVDVGVLVGRLLALGRTGVFHAASPGGPVGELELWRAIARCLGGEVIEGSRSGGSALLSAKIEAAGVRVRDWRIALEDAVAKEARILSAPLEVRLSLGPGESHSGLGPAEVEIGNGKVVLEVGGEDRICKTGRMMVEGSFRIIAVERSKIVVRSLGSCVDHPS